ncbi:hypothetical protein SAMN04488058_103224 [Deinococcus reticulitermitis]|uniref:Uncharacterized protein n=1 Tax=Deinococcus reticulitermitis TaxID=856736 RepID=A0A1H6VS05_9DEIO|nr:hypothetical protein [Deinococcus reticulitermitis]SEJ05864.1 hypothetical protein SAMN04488058_103224 [Deinococcus reticulitermitis]
MPTSSGPDPDGLPPQRVRPLWQTECEGQVARLDVLLPGRVRLRWHGTPQAGEVIAETVEDALGLAAADARLPPDLYTQLLTELDLVSGGPPRPWTPPEDPRT